MKLVRPLLADSVVVTVWVRRLWSVKCNQAAPPAPAQEATRLVLEPGLSRSWVGMEGAEGRRRRQRGSALGLSGPSSLPRVSYAHSCSLCWQGG